MALCDENQNVSAANPSNQQLNDGVFKTTVGYDPNMFDPNKILSAANTYNSLNYTVNQTLGMDTRWFRAVPQQRSKDVILQEYTLYCVEELPGCPKVMLNGGTFPQDDYNYDLMGLEYTVPSEIQIDKKYWEEMMGFGTAPQKKDIVYMVMPNKLYQVESSYLRRGFMQQETTWVINLIKYMPEAARREGDLLKQTIDQYTVSEEEIFGPDISANITKIVDDKQFSPLNTTERDKYKEIGKNVKIIASNLDIWGVRVAQSHYDMESDVSVNVLYKNSADLITTADDRSLTAWVKLKPSTAAVYSVNNFASNISVSGGNYIISATNAKNINAGDTLLISRPGALNFYGTVTDASTIGSYNIKIDANVITYLNSINSNWAGASNYKMSKIQPVNLLNGTNDLGVSQIKIDVLASQYIKIIYGDQTYVAPMPAKLQNATWYGIIVNIGNTWNQYNVQVWEEGLTSSDKLRTLFYDTIQFTPESISVHEYSINKSNSYLTNIRLFNLTIEEEYQSNELLSYFSSNADHGLILDNADPKFRAPYINKPR